jgi:calcium/calmodulin-dependent protein kinase (CaM kinase) II
MPDPVIQELLHLNQQLLESIARADWASYQELCDPTLTAFEPESLGQLVEGMAFHHFYFKGGAKGNHQTTMCAPRVRLLGDVAVVTYVRLDQRERDTGTSTTGSQETRVWHRQSGQWKHVHFHRSPSGFFRD